MKQFRLVVLSLMIVVGGPAMAADPWPTLADAKLSCLHRLSQVNNSRVADSVIEDFLNEAIQRCALDLGSVRKLDTIYTTRQEPIYAASSDAIDGWPIQIIACDSLANHDQWKGVPFKLIDDWVSTEEIGPSSHNGSVFNGMISLHPAPERDSLKLVIYYRAFPASWDLDTATCPVNVSDRPAMLNYACYLSELALIDPGAAGPFLSEYEKHKAIRDRQNVGIGIPVREPPKDKE